MLGSILIGSLIYLFRIIPMMDISAGIVRPEHNEGWIELYQTTYTDLGIISSVAFMISIGWLLFKKSFFGWIVNVVLMFIFLFGVITSGTRAVIGGLVLSPLIAVTIYRLKRKYYMIIICFILMAMIGVSLFPQYLGGLLPDSSETRIEGAESISITSEALLHGLQTRLRDWQLMLQSENFVAASLFGRPYEASINQAIGLDHTHNVFLWMYIMGGVVAIVLFTVLLISLLGQLHSFFSFPSKSDKHIAFVVTTCIFLLLFILVTNCWGNTRTLLLGFFMGITQCVGNWPVLAE